MVAGGLEVLPGWVFQVPPQVGVGLLVSKPLNAAGAVPPLRGLSLAHWAPQKDTWVPLAVLASPVAKSPPVGQANTMSWLMGSAVEPPSSTMCTPMVLGPSVA